MPTSQDFLVHKYCMANISRLNDLGHGFCKAGHPGFPVGTPKEFVTTFISGASTVFLNNKPLVIVGSLGDADCGHTTTAMSGSNGVFAENQPVHRTGDLGIINEGEGEYSVISASDDAEAG
jgi:hypothetical protein